MPLFLTVEWVTNRLAGIGADVANALLRLIIDLDVLDVNLQRQRMLTPRMPLLMPSPEPLMLSLRSVEPFSGSVPPAWSR